MSETENENATTEPGETVETDVETTEQPPGSQPTEVPAAEPETPDEPTPAERGAEETAPETPVGGAGVSAAGARTTAQPREARRRRARDLPRSLRRRRAQASGDEPRERKPIVRLPKPEHERGRRQERRGIVVSSAMDKTIVVKVESIRAHQRYKKVIRRTVKFHAHDEGNQANVGDLVRIVETRPLSKTKRWRLAEVLEQAK
jgi:small subunit ribosomal protein S17